MRTKTLLLTAVLGVAAAATSVAQVYSVNAVGYVTLNLTAGFTMISNPLDAGGTTGNTVNNTIGAQVPDGTVLYKFGTAGYSINSVVVGGGQAIWDVPDQSFAPGEGAFIKIPTGQTAKIVFVGEVKQGNLSHAVPKGFSIQSSEVPVQDVLTKDANSATTVVGLGFPAADGDTVYRWHADTKSYSIHSWIGPSDLTGQWDSPPTINVGESFWSKKVAASTWARTFSVNP